MPPMYTQERSQQIILSLLKAHGIRKVIASPGTTNITLVASMQQDPWFEMYSAADERSAAYMACGLAAECGEPVVLSCTGATASRNYLPGLTEAYYRKLPVLAITANQGRRLIGHLVAQNIDRRSIAHDVAVLSVSIPVTRTKDDEWQCEVLANDAMLALTRHGGGPVHIDLSTSYSQDFSVERLPSARRISRISGDSPSLPPLPSGRLALFIGSHHPFTPSQTAALDAFCEQHGAVAFCDHTSGYHGKYRVQFALVAGQKQVQSPLLNMDLLIHLGEVSGDYYTLHLTPKEVWRVSEDGELRDPFRRLSAIFEMTEEHFFKRYTQEKAPATAPAYLQECLNACNAVRSLIPELPFSNIWMAQQMAPALPPGSALHLGILNTLRSWNFFEIQGGGIQTFCNVGGFGIDGCISSLLGASLAHPDKLYIGIVGDLAFFYDMSALGNRHLQRNLRLMLINNGKGTEFRNYNHPAYSFGAQADPYIAASGHYGRKSPHLVAHMAEDLGFEYMQASGKEEFNQAIRRFLTHEATEKPLLLECFTDSEEESRALQIMLNLLRRPPETHPLKKLKGWLKKHLPS